MPERKHSLPSRHNPMLESERTPLVEILIERRRLGQTDLQVKPGLVGTSNATKAANLGKFDYVHLRIPLPKDLTGSEVFVSIGRQAVPESYFLMRRSSDGFVSGTGLFKASFPWATKAQEAAEKKYIKQLPGTDAAEVAGNVWITPQIAVSLATEYKISTWLEALLSDEEVTDQSIITEAPITSPPRFAAPPNPSLHILENEAHNTPTPKSNNMSSRKSHGANREVSLPRELRSGSPAKSAVSTVADALKPVKSAASTVADALKPAKSAVSSVADAISARPKATPRKRKNKTVASNALNKGSKSSDRGTTPSIADSTDELDDNTSQREFTPVPIVNGIGANDSGDNDNDNDATAALEDSEPLPENTVRVSVQSEVQDDGELQTTHTTVKVEVPANSPDLELPKDTEGVVEVAKEIIENMKSMQQKKIEAKLSSVNGSGKNGGKNGGTPSKKSLKRSRDDYEEDLEGPEELVEEEVEATEGADKVDGVSEKELEAARKEQRPAKRMRVMVPAEEYRREKVRGRALMGLGGAFAVGLLLPALANFFA